MKKQFGTYCKSLGIKKGESYLLALSGGGDSVCLFHLLRFSGIEFTAAHCNYQLRGEESDGDEQFVRSLCTKYGISLEVRTFDTVSIVEQSKGNIQEVARNIRYDWFFQLLEKGNYKGILTAHHLNDSIETSLFNFCRGTDLHGLSGIPIVTNKVLRPLSCFTKKVLLDYLSENSFHFRLDSSNLKSDYSRNKIRLEILPRFEEIFIDVDKRFRKSLENIGHADQFVMNQIEKIRKDLFLDAEFGSRISIEELNNLHPSEWTLSKLFAPFGMSSGVEILKLMKASSGKLIQSKEFRLIKHGDVLLLTKLAKKKKEYTITQESGTFLAPFKFTLGLVKKDLIGENFDVEFDCNTFDLPLTIRTWKNGDYFYPIGMKGKKKISDFYSDLKLSLPEKENTWLICSGNDIMYVVGHRQDTRFSVTNATIEKLGIKFN